MSSTKMVGKTIGEVEKFTGFPRRTLKYFIERDIMHPSCKSESGYWLYTEEDVRITQIIALLRNLGYSDKNIRIFLAAPFSQWREDLEQQIIRLAEKKDRVENQLFLAELLLYLDHINVSATAFDTSKYSPDYSEGIAWSEDTFRWKVGKKESFCRFLHKLFQEAKLGSPLYELSTLTDRSPNDSTVQKQSHQLCSILRQRNALSPAQILLMFRLVHTLSGMEPILNSLLEQEGIVQFITDALQTYCEQLQAPSAPSMQAHPQLTYDQTNKGE